MTTPITPVSPTALAQPDLHDPHATTHAAAVQFESLLVRQMLSTCTSSGLGAAGGYNGMAVDALADGLAAAGGLGLARQIEQALDRAIGTPPAAPETVGRALSPPAGVQVFGRQAVHPQ